MFSSKRKFDRYVDRKFIKTGGMASIYSAIDSKTNKVVALKIMHESLLKNTDLVSKFIREGETLEELQRDNYTMTDDYPIVRINRSSREDDDPGGVPFLDLEFIEGIDLDDFLFQLNKESIKLSVTDAAKIVLRVAEALSYMHRRRIWHRDVSPDNIMLYYDRNDSDDFKVKLIDFGVAKFEFMAPDTLVGGAAFGKPPYMSPEQCERKPVDGRSDIYTLGMVFYNLLAGKPAFTGDDPLSVIKMHLEEDIPPLPTDIPQELVWIVEKMTKKEVEARYQTIDEVLDELKSYLSDTVEEASPAIVYELIRGKEKKTLHKQRNTPAIFKSKGFLWSLTGILIIAALIVLYVILKPPGPMEGSTQVTSKFNETVIEPIALIHTNFYCQITPSHGEISKETDWFGIRFFDSGSEYYDMILYKNDLMLIKNKGDNNIDTMKTTINNLNFDSKIDLHCINNRVFIYVNDKGILESPITEEFNAEESNLDLIQRGNFTSSYNYYIENF